MPKSLIPRPTFIDASGIFSIGSLKDLKPASEKRAAFF